MSTISKHSTRSDDFNHKVQVVGDNYEYVILGGNKYLRHELMGALTTSSSSKTVFANPGPLGLCAFGVTTFVLCLINAQAGGITVPNAVVGCAMFYGGFVQFLAGVWEFCVGNTFGCTALTTYGAFWLSWGAIYVPGFGIIEAYNEDPQQLKQAAGFFLTGFAIFTALMTTLTFKTNIPFAALFSFLTMTFILLAAGDFTLNATMTKVGGVFGVITALLAFYNAFATMATKQNSYFRF